MTFVEPVLVKSETYYAFICRALKTEAFQVYQLAGDASNRRYYRVVQGDSSWVLMVWEPFEDNEKYPFLSVLRHLDRSRVHVPKVIDKSPSEGFVLLEDLGDLTLERKFWENQNQELAMSFYRMAIEELAKIHYKATADNKVECTAFHIAFDKEKLLWEMNYARKHLLEGICALQLKPSESKLLDEHFHSICQHLDQQPRWICHRDYHSRNLMIKLGKIRVIDFQDARMGPIQYDLVSLLKDSYVQIGDAMARSLLDYYFLLRLETQPQPLSRDLFRETYEIQTIQRCFKACGSFASFMNTRQDTRYLKYISHTLNHVRGSLFLFPKYEGFLNFLTDQGLFEMDFNKT